MGTVGEMFGHTELAEASIAQLLACRTALEGELQSRGYVRTASSTAGELMERVVAEAYSGDLTPPGAKGADVILADGRRLQVKVRSLPQGDLRHWDFPSVEFDIAVVIKMDRSTWAIEWARELTRAEALVLARPHAQDGMRIRMGPARQAGADVTGKLNAAYWGLR